MATERERRFAGPRRGQVVFAFALLLVAVVFLALIGRQTEWADKTRLFAQPRFWPAVGLGGMVLLAGLHLHALPWRHPSRYDRAEVLRWAAALEFAVWFMGYVIAVPVLGYLPVTLVFVPLLARRMGYRGRGMMVSSLGFALAVVLLFKSFLAVKIPGGAAYELLPGPLRAFFVLNF